MKKVKITLEIDVTADEMELTLKLNPSSALNFKQSLNETNTVYQKKPLEAHRVKNTFEEIIQTDELNDNEIVIVNELPVK